ncbi:hypothetical protein Halha_1603 [Halobacteroides halobius DSM 5150]|uniref:Nuclease SbcCD subunit C n=2 Tax=Halobacteroides TaxID=42417 RepID=L0K943_HALHC|nr:hypothetical protein Halha_1603 [Halobacteroides halobius DSM 5150]
MIKAIELENFQSHEDTRLEFSSGFNVITGPSDQGKSAIVRALRWVLYNEPLGDDYIRSGNKSCRVTVELENGFKIVRRRTPSKNGYIIIDTQGEKQVFERIGRDVPQKITKLHQMPKIELDTDYETTINLDYQLDGAFLLNQTGSIRAKALGRLLDIHLVDSASRETNKDIRQYQQEEKRLTTEIDECDKELKEFSDLPKLSQQITEEKKLLHEIKETKTKLEQVTLLYQDWKSIKQEQESLRELLAQLDDLKQIKKLLVDSQQQMDQLTNLKEIKGELDKTTQRLKLGKEYLAHFKNLTQVINLVPKIEATAKDLINLKQVEGNYQQATLELKNNIKLLDKLKNTKEVKKELNLALDLRDNLDKLQKLEMDLNNYQIKIKEVTNFLTLFPTAKQQERLLNNLKKYTQRLEQAMDFKRQNKKLNQGLEEVVADLKNVSQRRERLLMQYSDLLKEKGECPTCFSNVDQKLIKQIINNYREE